MYTVAVVTSTRAEYGLLRPVLHAMQQGGHLQPALVVTGAHLSAAYGGTVAEIEADSIPIAARVDYMAQAVAPGRLGTAQRTQRALELFIEYFAAHRPDAVLVLGDRYEIFAVAQAAALLDIPLAHISGGDVTQGADDDWFRHCITKMAKLHFPSCEEYRKRIIRMGEAPDTVYNVGGLGDENIRSLRLLTRGFLASSLDERLNGPYALVTFHPETATGIPVEKQADALLGAMERHPERFYLITKANADAGGAQLNARLEAFCEGRDNAALFASLGALRYLSAMQHAALVLGNSSSGVVETPSFGVPTVDIGERQKGRVTGENVVHCGLNEEDISKAIQLAVSVDFRKKAARAKSPYNGGNTSARIVDILAGWLEQGRFAGPKVFYDGEDAE